MDGIVDTINCDITCGDCGKEFKKPVGELKRDGQSVCPACGKTSKLDEAGKQLIAAAEQEVLDLRAKARALSKSLFKG